MTPDEVLADLLSVDLLAPIGQYLAAFVGAGFALAAAVWAIGYVVWFVIDFVRRA